MESFITPIILNYVEKYVILRPQDAQLSLWEGDVAFQNLDLRLDVLQEELQLPFEFLSGHIHELIIHIPWTKITSEPISVTINTIEFVLKLKDLNVASHPMPDKTKAAVYIEEAPKGYINALVNKIVNNISITCNNIILKYVEEDIVVSMNVQLLSFCSADEFWKQAFIEIGPTRVVLRKLVNVSDLTICLDKRNALGQIDVCQEPILYRCSLETRIMRKYNSATVQLSSTTNIEVFTKCLELNISSQQFPMAMRLIMLITALKRGELKNKSETNIQPHTLDGPELLSTSSMISWAWSKVPSLFSQEAALDDIESNKGHMLSIGFYIGTFKVTLKSVEMFTDSIVQNSRKIRYKPIIKLTLNGIFAETFIFPPKWVNSRSGISQAIIEPLGSFVPSNQSNSAFLITDSEHFEMYLAGSLFDPDANSSRTRTLIDWETHLREINKEYLLKRTPSIAIDMLHYINISDDIELGTEIRSDLEHSNLSEKTLVRVFVSSITVRHNSAFLRVLNTVKELIHSYDYPPYSGERREPAPIKLSPPSMDDYDALMNNIPRKMFELTLSSFRIEAHPLNEPIITSSKIGLHLRLKHRKRLPFIILYINHMQLNNVAPIYKDRLVHTTCQLPLKPEKLLDACYNLFDIKINRVTLSVYDNFGEYLLLTIPHITASYRSIIKHSLWSNDTHMLRAAIDIQRIEITFTRPQQILFFRIISTLFLYNHKALCQIECSSARKRIFNPMFSRIEINCTQVGVKLTKLRQIYATKGYIESIIGMIIEAPRAEEKSTINGKEHQFLLLVAPKQRLKDQNFLDWIIQIPTETTALPCPSIVIVTMKASALVIDPVLKRLLTYDEAVIEESLDDELPCTADESSFQDIETKSSKISVVSERDSKKTVHPEETIHISSDTGEKIESSYTEFTMESSNKQPISDILSRLYYLVLHVELDSCEIIIPARSVNQISKISPNSLENVLVEDYSLIKLPIIKSKSSNSTGIKKVFTVFPILSSDELNKERNGFPWTFSISDLAGLTNIKGDTKEFLLPVKTNITIALDTKMDSGTKHYALNLHLDTSPIDFNISVDQLSNLKTAIALLLLLPNLMSCTNFSPKISKDQSKELPVVDDDASIKDFLAMNSSSEISADVNLKDYRSETMFSLWLQWTLTKITIKLLVLSKHSESKLVVELEDFITSIDKQYVYFKLKSKLGVLNAQYFNLNEKQEWIANDALKLTVQAAPIEGKTSETFFDLTLTAAETGNIFKKWGAQKKNRILNPTLTEIVVYTQAIDLQLNMKEIDDLLPLINVLNANFNVESKTKSDIMEQKSERKVAIISVTDLPLFYFECKGVVLYLPLQKHEKRCDVFIVKIGLIKISPNVENPLTRIPIRPDIYTKAAQMRILNTPGSNVEDRQYELTVSGISTATSNWNEVVLYIKENSENFHNTNPAFEWNKQSKKPAVKYHELFKNFVFSITYAPCIIYKRTLIVGQSIELNCITDLVVEIAIDQLILLNNIFAAIRNYKCIQEKHDRKISQQGSNIQLSRSNSNLGLKIQRSLVRTIKASGNPGLHAFTKYGSLIRINKQVKAEKSSWNKIPSENIYADSGIASIDKPHIIDTFTTHSNISDNRHIPSEISFIAGVFSFRLFTGTDVSKSYSEKCDVFKIPLLAVVITQPSMLISQNLYERTSKYSLFNLMISFGETNVKDGTPKSNFGDIIFETRKGKLNNAGIPPPFLSITYKNTIFKNTEIECNMGKPTKLFFSPTTFEKIINIRSLLNDVFIVEEKETKNYIPVVRGTKIQLIRNLLFNADRIRISIEQTILECQSNLYNVKLSIGKINSNLDICDHPERLNFCFGVESLLLSTAKRVMIHPITINGNGTLLQETWNRFPIIVCKFEANVIHVDIGTDHIINLTQIQTIMMKSLSTFIEQYEHLSVQPVLKDVHRKNVKNLEPVLLPELFKKERLKSSEEFYQDDLRAGAFQFIEDKDDSEFSLPLPYQIQITTKNNGILCWRYPQPRFISRLQLHPVPLKKSLVLNIKCCLEHYNDALCKFVHYFEFDLSLTETQVFELPANKTSAYIWRIVILQKFISVNGHHFEDSIEVDEELQSLGIGQMKIEDVLNCKNSKDSNVLHPKELISCMRVDSLFSPHLVPKVQAVLDATTIQINFQNNFKIQEKGLPTPIQQFSVSRDFLNTQTFLSLVFSNVNLHGRCWTKEKYSGSLNMNISCTILDYSYLNMLHFLEHTNVKAVIDVRDLIETDIVIETIRLNVGSTIMHTILLSKQLWKQALNKHYAYSVILTRFVVCNCTNVSFKFGQTDSNEILAVKPNECAFYSFQCDHLKQQLTFNFDDKYINGNCAADIEKEGVQYLAIGTHVIIVKIEKLSTTQLCITLKGQVEFLSMSQENFLLQRRINNEKHQIELPQYGQGSFIGECNMATNHFLRVKFDDEKRKGWSGEIPLVSKTIPWLVKVPASTNHQYISFWVRIIVENIEPIATKLFKPKRILVIIWPMFVVRSLLTTDTAAMERETGFFYVFKGRGATQELQIAATNETEHELIFSKDSFSSQGKEKSKAVLSYKAMDWNKFFWVDEKFSSIELCIKELRKPITLNWPCSKHENLQINRITSPEELNSPIFRCLPSREFSCSLMLEILPWALFINSTGNTMKISNFLNEKSLIIDCNNIATLFLVEDAFTIGIRCDTHWIQSCPIFINENTFKAYTEKEKLMLSENGNVTVKIVHTSNISQYLLNSANENKVRIFTLSSAFAITNFSDITIEALPFAFGDNDKINIERIDELSTSFSLKLPSSMPPNQIKGISIDQFHDICGKNSQRGSQIPLKYYICLRSSNNGNISLPLLMNKPFNRKCFSIQTGCESIAVAACLIEKDGIFYVNIFNDTCPAVLLSNNTNLTFFVAPTKSSDCSSPVKITSELNDNNFEWYQIMRSKSKLYYTPPEMYSLFPDAENIQCNLSLALCTQNGSLRLTHGHYIRWSKPLQIGSSSEKLIHIPLHGDVKVIVCNNHKTVKLSIFYVTQNIEFSVKDLRTRLQKPTKIQNSSDLWEHTSKDTISFQSKNFPTVNDITQMDYNICTDQEIRNGIQKINVFVKEININVFVDAKTQKYLKTEIFSLYIDDIVFQLNEENRSMELILSNFQIDNQLYTTGNYDFPVVLCSQELYNRNNVIPSPITLCKDLEKYKSNALTQLRVNFYKERFSIHSIHCKINPIRSYIEDTYLNDLFDSFVGSYPDNVIRVYAYEDNVDRPKNISGYVVIPDDIINQAIYLSEPLKLRSFKIDPISVMLSVHTCVRLYIALDHSPLTFSTYERRNVLTLPLRFGHTLGMHYLSGALFGAGWVVGSLEILGSPSGLARSLSTGLRDFVSMPVQGLLRGPLGFLTGVTQGSMSLLRNLTAGTVNSVSKLAASVARNLDRLTLDEEHFQRTEALRRSRPQGFTDGFAQGLTGFGISLLGAVGGLARHPLEAKSSVGLVTGVAKGIFGALAKPLSGAAELVALTGQGMLHTVGFNTMPRQRNSKATNTTAYPADCKISRRILPNLLYTDQVLFYHDATMITENHLKQVILCLTPSALTILPNDKDDILEVVPIERIEIVINEKDSTLIEIKVLHSDEYCEEESHFINKRILSFLRDSSDHLPSTSTLPFDALVTLKSIIDKNYKLQWSFYISRHLALHLLQYINVIKYDAVNFDKSVE